MTPCATLSERMPAVARGQGAWTPEELEHLGRCASCRREWKLVRLAQRMGEGRLPPFEAMASASRLLQRLESEAPKARSRAWALGGVAAAAVLALFFWTGERVPPPPPTESAALAGTLEILLPELDGLEPAELDSVLRTMDEVPAGNGLESPELGDLNSEELETVLDVWEG
jgi:hypothetical protein